MLISVEATTLFPYKHGGFKCFSLLKSSLLWLLLHSASLLTHQKADPDCCRPSQPAFTNCPTLVHCKETSALVSTAFPCDCSIPIPHHGQPPAALPPLQSPSNRTSKIHHRKGAPPSPCSMGGMEEFKWPRKDGQQPVMQPHGSSGQDVLENIPLGLAARPALQCPLLC